jgi:hypothetical protein
VRGAITVAVLTGALLLQVAAQAPITEAQRVEIIRTLVAEAAVARKPLPTDKHGVEITPEGKVLNAGDVLNSLNEHGQAVKVGGRAVITNLVFKGDSIVFDINGGPVKTHWYDHLQIGMGGGMSPVDQNGPRAPGGAQITLKFAHGLPALTPAEVKADLGSLLDWDPPSKAEVMVRALPAPVKAAIANHHVLVGMNSDMVVAALGRTGNKIRERDPASGITYEDWIYGEPPNSTFVRLEGDRVVRVTTYEAGGVVKVETEPDPALASLPASAPRPASASASPAAGDQAPPTLRRPGDAPPPTLNPGGAPPMINQPPPQQLPGSGMPGGLPTGVPPASSPGGPGGPPY